MLTTLHYADDLDTPRNNAFRTAYAKAYKLQPDVYAVQGYDAAQMLGAGLDGGQGRHRPSKAELAAAMRRPRSTARAASSRSSQVAQPGAGHLPARGRGQGEQGRSASPSRRSPTRPRLQDVADAPVPQRGCAPRERARTDLIALSRATLAPLTGLPMDFATFLVQCLNAVQYGLLLFLVASGPDADLRDHGRHQPRARQLLHDRRLPGVRAGAAASATSFLADAARRAWCSRRLRLRARVGVLQLPLPARPPAAGADDLRR